MLRIDSAVSIIAANDESACWDRNLPVHGCGRIDARVGSVSCGNSDGTEAARRNCGRQNRSAQRALILERGEGDSVFAVFGRANDAVAAAFEIQCELRAQTWPANVPIRVRMAIHTGEAGADYRGPHVNRAARLRAIAHGEQILISGVTAGIVRGALPAGASLLDLGQHRLRDVSETEHVFQLAHPELRIDFPP